MALDEASEELYTAVDNWAAISMEPMSLRRPMVFVPGRLRTVRHREQASAKTTDYDTWARDDYDWKRDDYSDSHDYDR